MAGQIASVIAGGMINSPHPAWDKEVRTCTSIFRLVCDAMLILVQGWAGIFVVICIIWAVVAILNNVTGKKKEEKQ